MGSGASKPKQVDPPFIPECEVLYEGGPDSKLLYENCKKYPGHPQFIPVKDFSMEHLPPDYQTEQYLKDVKVYCDLTVKITVNYTSLHRPDTYPSRTRKAPYPYAKFKGSTRVGRCGTGMMCHFPSSITRGKPCPCPLCKSSGSPKMEYGEVIVWTATHVVFDESEAKCVVCELFYDSESDREGKKYLYGVGEATIPLDEEEEEEVMKYREKNPLHDEAVTKLINTQNGDRIYLTCVTHNMELYRLIDDVTHRDVNADYPIDGLPLHFIISHPHGRSKHVTVGNILYLTIPLHATQCPDSKLTFGRGGTCRLAKGYNEWSLERFQHFLISMDDSIPHVEHHLYGDMKIKLPADATFLCKVDNTDALKPWIRFPYGTKFKYGSRVDWFCMPDVEFNLNGVEKNFIPNDICPCYQTYDTPTCPGSSGAPVVSICYGLHTDEFASHSGALKPGVNKSDIFKKTFYML